VSEFATVQDVTKRYEGTAPADVVQVQLDDAELLLRQPGKVPDLADRITAGDLDPELVRLVLVWAVCRYLRNPEGYKAESDGDRSVSHGLAGVGRVEFTAEELAMLRGARDTTQVGWGTVRTVLPPDRAGSWHRGRDWRCQPQTEWPR
jgi:hypothetical protein